MGELTNRIKETLVSLAIVGSAMYSISYFDIGRGFLNDIGRSNGCSYEATQTIDKHFYEKPDLITLGLILGGTLKLLKGQNKTKREE